jgi:hypothetical protein
MDEERIEKSEGFRALRVDIERLISRIVGFSRDRLPAP